MASTACIDTTQKGLPCPVPPLAGRDVCHFHAKVRDREAQRKEEDAERAVRGVKLCGGFNRKCPDGAEIPLTQKLNTCDACTKTVRERALANKAKRDAATAERNKANASAGVRECSNCHEKFPPSEFETERKKSDSYRLGAGEKVSDRCRGCRERVRELKAAGTIPERSKTNREEEKAARKAIAEKAAAEGKRICSRHGSVTDGCWVVLPDAYEPPTCEPCIKLREDYNASKRKKKEEKKAKSTEEETQPKEEAEEMKEGEIKNPAMDTGSTAGENENVCFACRIV